MSRAAVIAVISLMPASDIKEDLSPCAEKLNILYAKRSPASLFSNPFAHSNARTMFPSSSTTNCTPPIRTVRPITKWLL